MPDRPSGYAVCIGKWTQQKVAQHGRVPERSRFKRNPGSSARYFFFQADVFVKGAESFASPTACLVPSGFQTVGPDT